MNKQLGTRHDEKLIARIGLQAELLNISLTQYVDNALKFYSSLDTRFLKGLNGLAEDMGISPGDLAQRIIGKWMAKIDANMEIYGYYTDLAADTMTQGDFEADYNMHKQHEIIKLEKEIVLAALESEKYGAELEDYEKRLLIKYRQGKAWENSEEAKREQEIKKHIAKESPEEIKSEIEQLIAKMSPEEKKQFIERLENMETEAKTPRKAKMTAKREEN